MFFSSPLKKWLNSFNLKDPDLRQASQRISFHSLKTFWNWVLQLEWMADFYHNFTRNTETITDTWMSLKHGAPIFGHTSIQ